MKNIKILTVLLFSVVLYQCQKKDSQIEVVSSTKKKNNDSLVLNVGKDLFSIPVHYMKLYKFNEQNYCNQNKAVSVIYDNQLSSCFDYVKTINGKDIDDFLGTIKNPKTYGGEDVACFDTDYSLILYNIKDEVVGYINISESCNKLISNPEIKEREFYSKNGLRKVGFSKKGKEKIKKILKI
ncbi:hypothetical protein [Chryseobacterium gleum]|uniref:hypothetical protein n=1 Tax=Chryseobacterium gleum TaxID=250 RepID=UPI0031E03327